MQRGVGVSTLIHSFLHSKHHPSILQVCIVWCARHVLVVQAIGNDLFQQCMFAILCVWEKPYYGGTPAWVCRVRLQCGGAQRPAAGQLMALMYVMQGSPMCAHVLYK